MILSLEIVSYYFVFKIFSALSVDYVELMILWEVKKSLLDFLHLCVERKLTGFSSTKLETLEEKSILILCAYPVTGRLNYGKYGSVAYSLHLVLLPKHDV